MVEGLNISFQHGSDNWEVKKSCQNLHRLVTSSNILRQVSIECQSLKNVGYDFAQEARVAKTQNRLLVPCN